MKGITIIILINATTGNVDIDYTALAHSIESTLGLVSQAESLYNNIYSNTTNTIGNLYWGFNYNKPCFELTNSSGSGLAELYTTNPDLSRLNATNFNFFKRENISAPISLSS